jgi:hypothetical protein
VIKIEEEHKTEGGAGEWRPWGERCHAVQGARAGGDGARGRSHGREQINICIRGGRHCNKGDIDARGIIPEKAARVGKGQDELLVRCGLDEAAKKEENTAEGEPVQSSEDRIEIEIEIERN